MQHVNEYFCSAQKIISGAKCGKSSKKGLRTGTYCSRSQPRETTGQSGRNGKSRLFGRIGLPISAVYERSGAQRGADCGRDARSWARDLLNRREARSLGGQVDRGESLHAQEPERAGGAYARPPRATTPSNGAKAGALQKGSTPDRTRCPERSTGRLPCGQKERPACARSHQEPFARRFGGVGEIMVGHHGGRRSSP